MSKCTSGCKTQDHESWGACLRAKNIRVDQLHLEEREAQKRADRDLDAYATARKQGVQPRSTRRTHTEAAMKKSEQIGRAYDAS